MWLFYCFHIFINRLDLRIIFSFGSQKEDFNRIYMNERLDDMILLYAFKKKKGIAKNPENGSSLPHVGKVLMSMIQLVTKSLSISISKLIILNEKKLLS